MSSSKCFTVICFETLLLHIPLFTWSYICVGVRSFHCHQEMASRMYGYTGQNSITRHVSHLTRCKHRSVWCLSGATHFFQGFCNALKESHFYFMSHFFQAETVLFSSNIFISRFRRSFSICTIVWLGSSPLSSSWTVTDFRTLGFCFVSGRRLEVSLLLSCAENCCSCVSWECSVFANLRGLPYIKHDFHRVNRCFYSPLLPLQLLFYLWFRPQSPLKGSVHPLVSCCLQFCFFRFLPPMTNRSIFSWLFRASGLYMTLHLLSLL